MAISFKAIRQAIETKISSEWDEVTYPIAWENSNFDSTDKENYIAPILSYINSTKLEMGIDGLVQINGILRCDVVGERQKGMPVLEEIADTFLAIFNEINLSIDAQRYIFFSQGFLNGPFVDENRVTLQVIIPFRCIQQGG